MSEEQKQADDKPFVLTPESMREAVEKAKETPVAGPEAGPVAVDEAAPVDEKRWGMPEPQVREFFYLVFLGLERMSQRQRTFFRRNVKNASRDLNALWPRGKPMDKIRQEAEAALAEDKAKTKIIIPKEFQK